MSDGLGVRTLVWFRGKDLRLSDHAPLDAALGAGEVVPVFVLDPFFFEPDAAARMPHRMQFLLDSLRELSTAIERKGSRLLLARGRSVDVIAQLARRFKVDRVVAERWSEPVGRARDAKVQRRLHVPLQLFEGETLHTPGSLRTQSGTAFSVFGAFARAFARQVQIRQALPEPQRLPALPSDIAWDPVPVPSCEELGLRRNPELQAGGEAAASGRLQQFLAVVAGGYHISRDRLDLPGSSRLSADLKFGTLSVRSVWHAVSSALGSRHPEALTAFQNELLWREFARAILWEHPRLLARPFRTTWADFPWRDDAQGFDAWCCGATGYPVVDAAARQLLAQGFVPNRARMLAASFLTKHLLVDYRKGEQHYLKFLTDGDWANNNLGWQWCAGCGTDAQPYFRVFNPVTQAKKFDPEGHYVRRWVPELSRLPASHIHAPWEAPADVLSRAGVKLGVDYPQPIVEPQSARSRFLAIAQSHLAARPT